MIRVLATPLAYAKPINHNLIYWYVRRNFWLSNYVKSYKGRKGIGIISKYEEKEQENSIKKKNK
jgi:hypothetical protein